MIETVLLLWYYDIVKAVFCLINLVESWGSGWPEEAAAKIAEQRKEITGVPRNLEDKVIFGGRLGEYKYYDMDQVIAAALERVEGL